MKTWNAKSLYLAVICLSITSSPLMAQQKSKKSDKKKILSVESAAAVRHSVDYQDGVYADSDGSVGLIEKNEGKTRIIGQGGLTLDVPVGMVQAFASTDGHYSGEALASPLSLDDDETFRPAFALKLNKDQASDKVQQTFGAGIRVVAKKYRGHLLLTYGNQQVILDTDTAKTLGIEAQGRFFISNLSEIVAGIDGKYDVSSEPNEAGMDKMKGEVYARLTHRLFALGGLTVNGFTQVQAALAYKDGAVVDGSRAQALTAAKGELTGTIGVELRPQLEGQAK